MHIGFTGTQTGMTEHQKERVKESLEYWYKPNNSHFHHGDCVGADEQAATIADDLGYTIHCHPPKNPKKRAYFKHNDVMNPEKEYLERDRDIADGCDLLIATPKTHTEQKRGGTWYTIRYAMDKGHNVHTIYP